MDKVNKLPSKTGYIDLTDDKQDKEIKRTASSKKQSIEPKNENKTPDNKQLHERKSDVQCYKDICDQMKTVGSRVAQIGLDKITSSETPKSKDAKKSKGLFGGLLQSIKGAVVNSVTITHLKSCADSVEKIFLLISFDVFNNFITSLGDFCSNATSDGRLLNAAGIPGDIKTVIDNSQKSKETINEKNTKEISKNILKAAKQILPIMQKSSPMIKKLQMGKALETIQKNLPSEKDCPVVIEKLVNELLAIADLCLKNPKSMPDEELLKRLLNKAVEILQKKK